MENERGKSFRDFFAVSRFEPFELFRSEAFSFHISSHDWDRLSLFICQPRSLRWPWGIRRSRWAARIKLVRTMYAAILSELLRPSGVDPGPDVPGGDGRVSSCRDLVFPAICPSYRQEMYMTKRRTNAVASDGIELVLDKWGA